MLRKIVHTLRDGVFNLRLRRDLKRRGVYVAKGTVIQRGVEIGDHTSINRASFLTSCKIGRHCAIAGPLTVRSTNHDINALALQAHTQKDLVRAKRKTHGLSRAGVCVGDNVWVGDSVILLDGAQIGHSSIVAAGSVVNKTFPPFSVIGGVPARLIKRRFSEDKIALLDAFDWWNWDVAKMRRNSALFEIDLQEVSIDELQATLSEVR